MYRLLSYLVLQVFAFPTFSDPLLQLVLVGLLWGVTNPFLKQGSSGIDKISENNLLKKLLLEIVYLVTNWSVSDWQI